MIYQSKKEKLEKLLIYKLKKKKKNQREPGDNWVYYKEMLIGDSSRSERNILICISCILWYSCWLKISYIWDQKLGERLKGKDMVSHIL
jgi:hypothetical protein